MAGADDADSARARSLAWLGTPDGEALLAEASALPDDRLTRLTRLRKVSTPEIAAVAVELIELRGRARAKFSDAERMFFTPGGLEQATAEPVAAYRAGRLIAAGAVLDACCGIGGDARMLAERGPVIAVDRNPAAIVCARQNTRQRTALPGDSCEVRALCADVVSLPLARLADRGVRGAFFDPSRRTDPVGRRRTRLRSADDYSPPLDWLRELRAHFTSVAVKVSPAIDDAAIVYEGVRVEFLSYRGECRETVLWFGESAEALRLPETAAEPYFATVIRPGEAPATLSPFSCSEAVQDRMRDYLYEPDPAVIRAHLVPQAASLLDAAAIEPGIAYLTSDRLVVTPFATSYRIIETLPYQRKEIQKRVRALGARVDAVKKRGVPVDPMDVWHDLEPCGPRPLIIALTRVRGRIIAILCERAGS